MIDATKFYIYNYRLSNGTAAATATSILKTAYLNDYHYSPDPLYSTHMTYIVPKGSPLQVEQTIVRYHKQRSNCDIV